jgi:RNA polymerase sigma-70 factor (ECF subfamily)
MEVAGIYTQFHNSLLSFIRSKIKSREDAEDILQNVFIKISANVNGLADEEKLQSWIFTITRNAIIDYYRAHASKKSVSIEEDQEENMLDDIQTDPTKGLDQCINTMINLLPDEYKSIIIDSELKGIKQKDMAEKYGMAYPSMRSRVQRGRERLKQLLYNCCHIETDRHGNVLEARGRTDCNGPCTPCPDKDAALNT